MDVLMSIAGFLGSSFLFIQFGSLYIKRKTHTWQSKSTLWLVGMYAFQSLVSIVGIVWGGTYSCGILVPIIVSNSVQLVTSLACALVLVISSNRNASHPDIQTPAGEPLLASVLDNSQWE